MERLLPVRGVGPVPVTRLDRSGQNGAYSGTGRHAFDRAVSADLSRPFRHGAQPHPSGLRVEVAAGPVVPDGEREPVRVDADAHPYAFGPSVAQCVVQRFGGDAVGGDLDGRRKRRQGRGNEVHVDPGPGAVEGADQLPQGAGEAQFTERRGT